ncbi:flavin reductase family protein [Thermoflexibacter ruber]|uniref:NADH-FMN oxidoreductase RutF, flavin reductase (DIM6/NTAB) family n=1 Tax=Thermoflexibacter ruber TaxID=1003 RepID=A0A1I2F0Z8_9BACT|nr:flavin reductase family protein [Thermoflexibacter ruber]SFE99032.1 NADH-FMN oxidoreductase RutF, flavin reductase (DIM6/NTAB) family [Thermoflexibacter ruber]
MSWKTIYPQEISTPTLQNYLQSVVAPRPIAFASTMDKEGKINLSPFSFFNLFSANPPIVVFSPSRRVRDNTTKHTLDNVIEVPEVVINIVNYNMVEQTSLASTEYEKGVNEFVKAGLSPEPSVLVKPPRVAESPAALECKVKQVIPLGEQGGAGNLVICEVILMHLKEEIFDENGKISPYKIDLVARMGGDWYSRSQGEMLFEVPKPLQTKGIGVDNIPERIRNSTVLTGNNLGRLGNIEQLPSQAETEEFKKTEEIRNLLQQFANQPFELEKAIHQLAQTYLEKKEVLTAWKVLLSI